MNQNERREKISEIIGAIDDKYINEAGNAVLEAGLGKDAQDPAQKKILKLPARKAWIIATAAMLVLLIAGGSAAAITAEAKEYKAAVAFFEANELPMEGLSRAEVKEVYRDIITRKFTSEKTEKILRERLAGLEIIQDEPTPDELKAAWDRNLWKGTVRKTGYSYLKEVVYKDNRPYEDQLDKSIVECYQDGGRLWTAEIRDFIVQDCRFISGRTIAWGYRFSGTYQTSWLACLDGEGKLLWAHPLWHRFQSETITSVLDNGDGTIEVVSRGDGKYLALLTYDMEGGKLHSAQTEAGNTGIFDAVRLEDGYLVRMGSYMKGETAHLVKIDRDANMLESYDIEAEDCIYTVTGMVQYGGRIYLSAYATPRRTYTGEEPFRNPIRDEIYDVLQKVFDQGIWEIPSEELTPMVREQYTAVLFVCGQDIASPETFYSVKGSMGGELQVNAAGELEWDVESISETFFSPATSSFTIGGVSEVYRYTFDKEGNLLSQNKTGEKLPYRR